METSIQSFNVGMYREHLEDASFLYDQRNALMSDGITSWVRLHDFEERMEAHIDALIVGGELALKTCGTCVVEADAGELFAVVSVFSRCRNSAAMADVWSSLDFADRSKLRAVTDALSLELPEEWYPACEQALVRGNAELVPIMSAVCAARRRPVGRMLIERLEQQPHLVSPQLIMDISKTSAGREALPALERYCSHPAAAVRAAALTGLLYLGERRALKSFYLTAQTEDWPQLALGLGGDQSAALVLIQCAEGGRASRNTLLALGLLGDLSACGILCKYLAHPNLAAASALALHWLTGAQLYEDEFVPEPIDERELLDAELRAWQQRGEPPRRIDGRPFGHILQRLTTDEARWQAWLNANSGRFDTRSRHRYGLPVSASILLARLLDDATPRGLRQMALDELVVRFGCPLPFDLDWHVARQRRALRSVAKWVLAREAQMPTGSWQ